MKRIPLLLLVGICVPTILSAQKAPVSNKEGNVLLDIAGEKVTKSEFERVYHKNNFKDNKTDNKSLQEYLELFINYKLKVREALEEKLDTSRAFKSELNGYRKQLAQPYLTDRNVSEGLVKEVYDRMQRDIHAIHILIRVAQDALPKDTLIAYNKAMAARERVMKGEDFGAVAKELSEDASAKENHGDLGFFTAMQMVYPFETAAYNAKVGEVTKPVRTRFGYHIVKVIETRPAQGEIHVAHIMVKTAKNLSTEDSLKARVKIEELHKKLKEGSSFEDLAKQYSDDVNSGRNGGVLPWFSTGRMVPEFEKASYALANNGDVSEPIRTSFGWHIIKRIEKKHIPSFDVIQNELKAKVSKDSRSEAGKKALVAKVKRECQFKENPLALNEFITKVDSTISQGNWSADKSKGLNKLLFSLQDKKYTQQDFAQYIESHQTRRNDVPTQAVANALYKQFVEESCIAFEESRLDKKYDDFRALMQEYRDGILLFDITDKKVWGKAVRDSAGLANFYNNNKKKYMWGERLEATIYSCQNEAIAKQVRETFSKQKLTNDSLLALINKNSQLNLTIREAKFSKGESDIIDSIPWQKGITANFKKNKNITFVDVKEKHNPEEKTLDEARGLVTADYQNYLEKEWIKTLRNKYHVDINNAVLNTIKP